MTINCQILDLRAFLVIVELGSFHGAAEALNLSQPALSRRIKKLEASVGAPLLERTSRSLSVTALGNELIPLVRRMLEEFDNSLLSARGDTSFGRQLLSIACLPTVAVGLLPRVVRQFKETFPRIRFRILDLKSIDVLQAVSRGEVEFGINLIGASDPDLHFEPLVEDPFVLAASKHHPLAEKDVVEWADLKPYSLIVIHRSSGNRTLLDATLARRKLTLNWAYEVTRFSTALGLVHSGLGIALLPSMAVPQGNHPNLITRQVGDPPITRTIGIVHRRSNSLSPPAQQFRDMLVSVYGKTFKIDKDQSSY